MALLYMSLMSNKNVYYVKSIIKPNLFLSLTTYPRYIWFETLIVNMSKRRASEVVIARGRLKGALQDIANVAEDYDDLDSNKPSRGRPPKRVKKELTPPPQTSVQHSFLMKLFDRCVDLAKYNEDTPLYPICRAWMINQPRSNQIINYKVKKEPVALKREPIPNLLEDLKSEKITEVIAMPACKSVEFSRTASLLSFQKKGQQVEVDLNYDPENPIHERDELLAQMKERWNLVRNKWTEHSKEHNMKKYGTNLAILDALFLGNR